ncbi:hypothetical protein V6N12_071283 [Hibiscus sabdariffa]|uniref:Uncharacterized protein n=1 Tax=Hibiscus sabdariffa TaxID=183260 RepID=A0ABR2FJC7_9ROSI
MHFVDKMSSRMRRVWTGMATRLGGRKSGLFKLQKDVRSCEYRDVQVMWEMLKRSEAEMEESTRRSKKRAFKRCFAFQRTGTRRSLRRDF